jgi:hypothetical protein
MIDTIANTIKKRSESDSLYVIFLDLTKNPPKISSVTIDTYDTIMNTI